MILRTPEDLARQLNVTLPNATVKARENGYRTTAHHGVGEPVDLVDDPDVQAALEKATDDRSADIYRILAACSDAGFIFDKASAVVHSRADLVEKLNEVSGDDLTRTWIKLDTKQREQVQIADGNTKAHSNTESESPDPNADHGSPIADYRDALKVFKKWLHINDTAPVLAVAATIVANLADGEPVWLLLIGPPSGGKTEIISSCFGLPYVVPIATITEAALLSGTAKRDRTKDATGGVLRMIGEFGILGCKDFTSVLSQNKDTAKSSMAACREIYDGSWDRPVGTDGGKILGWKGKCGFLGGATPSYDRYGSVVNALGDRFLLQRLPDVDPAKQAVAALKAAQHEKVMRQELAAAMVGLIASADLSRVHADLTEKEVTRLVELAEFTARVRTAVERDGYTGELLVMPQPEGPARLVKAMRQLYGALIALGVEDDIRWEVLGRIAVDCAPAIRVPLMRQLLATNLQQKTAEIADAVGLVTKTVSRHLDDLTLLAVAERTKEKNAGGVPVDNSANLWRASDWLRTHWPEAGQKNTTRREGEIEDEDDAADDGTHSGTLGTSLSRTCSSCGNDLLAPTSVERGQCERCWLTANGDIA